MNERTIGMSAISVAAVIVDAPLHPSCPHVSQNSVRMYDGVDNRMQLSAGALISSHEHDLETTILSLTVKKNCRKKICLSSVWTLNHD